MRVRHKPTVIDAVRWDDTDDARRQLADLGYRADCGDFRYGDGPEGARVLLVPSPEGDRPALPAESYVMRGTQREWYPILATTFRACYDPIVGGAS